MLWWMLYLWLGNDYCLKNWVNRLYDAKTTECWRSNEKQKWFQKPNSSNPSLKLSWAQYKNPKLRLGKQNSIWFVMRLEKAIIYLVMRLWQIVCFHKRVYNYYFPFLTINISFLILEHSPKQTYFIKHFAFTIFDSSICNKNYFILVSITLFFKE